MVSGKRLKVSSQNSDKTATKATKSDKIATTVTTTATRD